MKGLKFVSLLLCFILMLTGCGTQDNTVEPGTMGAVNPAVLQDGVMTPEEQEEYGDTNPDHFSGRIMVDGEYLETEVTPLEKGNGVWFPVEAIVKASGVTLTQKEKEKEKEMEGTNYGGEDFFQHLEGMDFSYDELTKTAVVTTDHPHNGLYLYDLGKGTLHTQEQGNIPYEKQGIIGLPKEPTGAIAIILHGCHTIEKAEENRYDLGFSYLVKGLAQKGILAVAVNIGMNYSYEAGETKGAERTGEILQDVLDDLGRAIQGEKLYPCDLTGKGDLNQLVLIGHSRAGLDILQLEGKLQGGKVCGLLSLAPACYLEEPMEIPDVPLGIVLPQFDGEVANLDGNTLYERAAENKGRKTPVEEIYLEGANHAGFSTALLRQDFAGDRGRSIGKAQRDFTIAYAKEFITQAVEHGQTVLSTLDSIPQTLYGASMVALVDGPGEDILPAADSFSATEGARVHPVVSSWDRSLHTAGNFRLPGLFSSYSMLQLQWEEKKAEISFPVKLNLAGKQWLSLQAAIDSTHPLNQGKSQEMTCVLTDEAGKKVAWKWKEEGALRYQWGELEEQMAGEDMGEGSFTYSVYTPFGTMRIPLTHLQGVDKKKIRKITFRFDTTAPGSIMIKRMEVQ